MTGDVSQQMFATVPDLLAKAPTIHPAGLIAYKGV